MILTKDLRTLGTVKHYDYNTCTRIVLITKQYYFIMCRFKTSTFIGSIRSPCICNSYFNNY